MEIRKLEEKRDFIKKMLYYKIKFVKYDEKELIRSWYTDSNLGNRQKAGWIMTADNLCVTLEDMLKATESRKIKWRVEMATSEYQNEDEKPVVEADGKNWTVDECYTAYSCEFRGRAFSMITYENMEKSDGHVRTTNLVFLPPIAMRVFHLDELAPYALETSALLVEKVHRLWNMLLTMYREDSDSVGMDIYEIKVKE